MRKACFPSWAKWSRDRKSTRLNSSHGYRSYAVFCLKKKNENVKEFMQGFRYDAHPMGMLLASVGALSPFYPEASRIKDEELRYMQVIRLIAKMPTLAAFVFRHAQGKPYVYPDNELSYPGNFLSMIYKMTEIRYEP